MKLILKKYMMPIILSIITIVLLTLLRLIKQTSFSINELSLSVDFGYDFATKAYSIPSLDAYFA